MNGLKYLLFPLLLCSLSTKVNAQISIDDQKTPQQLIEDVLINSSCASVSDITGKGDTFTLPKQSFAYFNRNGSNFPFSEGIVLTTSTSREAIGPFINNTNNNENDGWIGDNDLEQILGINTINATSLEFDFVAVTNSISFNYIFASNEYQYSYPCEYSDGFAFLIKEKGTTDPYKNLALIPDSSSPVSSFTIHPRIEPGIIPGNNRQYDGCIASHENYFNGLNTNMSPINYAGQTIVMTAQTDVTPGNTYHIKLVIADATNKNSNSAVFLEAGSFVSNINLGNDRTIANNNPVCIGKTIVLNSQLDNTQYSFKWFKLDASNSYVDVSPPQSTSNYDVTTAGNYQVKAYLNGSTCIATGKIKIEYAPASLPTNTSLIQCDDDTDGITKFNLTKVDQIAQNNASAYTNKGYYEYLNDAQNFTNPITNPQKYTNHSDGQIVFASFENQYGCLEIVEVMLKVSTPPTISPITINMCDIDGNPDGLYKFNLPSDVTSQLLLSLPNTNLSIQYYLNSDDALIETNALPDDFTNTSANSPTTIYARINTGADCFGIIPIKLEVHVFDPPNFEDESQILCKGKEATLSINPDPSFVSYAWSTHTSSTNSILIHEAGDYSVTVTDANGCEKTKKFKIISSEPATITNAIIKDFSGIDNTVLLEYTGVGNYEFSLDGIVFQDEPLFTRVTSGIYNAIARDKNACGLSNEFLLYILDYPRFFTPNGDGFNDSWAVKDFDQLPDYKISIFDRYGKLLKQMSKNSPGWTGLFNGQPLPADDYWFNLLLATGQTIKGHFSIKR